MKRLRLYLDTSVIGGCLDPEFSDDSLALINAIRLGKAIVLVSDVVINEIEKAPLKVQEILESLRALNIELVELTPQVKELRDAYINAGIVGEKSINDATHVACASVVRADAIVSWNFKHLVNLDKMKAYNQVNFFNGYSTITIVTPKEVRFHA